MSEPEVYMWVKEHPARFDPYEGGEPASTEFLDEPTPGAIALIRMDDPAIATLQARVKQLEEEASFLLDRLREFESEMDYGEVSASIYWEYSGHVTPSVARLRALLNGGSNEHD